MVMIVKVCGAPLKIYVGFFSKMFAPFLISLQIDDGICTTVMGGTKSSSATVSATSRLNHRNPNKV